MRPLVRGLLIIGFIFSLVPALWAAPTAADQAFASAQQLYRTENDEQAVTALKGFLATYPKDARNNEATFMLGSCYQRLQKWPEALAAYTLVTKATGADTARRRGDACFQMGDCYSQTGDFEKAAAAYDSALKLVTDDKDFIAQAQYWKASSLYQLGRGPDALPLYRAVVDGNPDHPLAPWSLYSIGVIQLEAGNFAQAIQALQDVSAKFKDSDVIGDARLKLAYAYLERARAAKDPAAADADRQQALPMLETISADAALSDDLRVQAVLMLARAYIDMDKGDQAVAACTPALAKDNVPADIALNLRMTRGDAYYNTKHYAEAAADYEIVAKDPKATQPLVARYWQGNALYQQGLANKDGKAFTAAIDSLRALQKLDGADKFLQAPRVALLIGLCYQELDDLGDKTAAGNALAAFKAVSDKWPNSKEATEAKGRIANQTNEMPIDELEKLAATLPAGETLWNVMLRLAREKTLAGQYDNAAAAAQKLLDAKPTPAIAAGAAYLKGVALIRLNRGKEAIPLFNQVIANPQAGEVKPLAQRAVVQAYLQGKQFPEARQAALALVAQPIEAKEKETELSERLMLLAQAYVGTQQYPEADAAYQRVIKECPNSAQAPYALMGAAWVAEARKDLPAADAVYQDFLAKFPTHELLPEAQFRLGANLVQLKEYEKAIPILQQVPATYQLADEAAYKIGWAYRGWGKTEEANAQFAKLAEGFPQSPFAGAALFHLGEAAMEKNQYQDARGFFQRALEKMAADYSLRPAAQLKMGASAYELRDYATAAEQFGNLAANDKAGDLADQGLFWKAKSLEQQGDAQQQAAREAYQQYVAKYPTGGLVLDAQLGAGRTALALKKTTDARADLQKALDLSGQLPDKNPALADRAKNVQPEAQCLLGQAAMDDKQYDEALKQFALVSAYNMEPWYSRSLLQMARCSALAGNTTAAEKTLAMLKKNFPDSEAAKQIPQVAEEFKLKVE